jgi:hypothetical protein
MCKTRQTRRHSPSRVARTRQTRRHSPTIYRVLARLADIRQAVLRGLARLAKGKFGKFWRVLREFSESGKSCKFGDCRLDRFIHIKYVICAKNNLSYHACLRRAVLRGLARLADIRQAVLRGLAKLANIRRAVLRGLAKLANIRQPFTEYSPDSPTFPKRHF